MKLFLFNPTSAVAGGAPGARTGAGAGRARAAAAGPFGGGPAERAAQATFARRLQPARARRQRAGR